MSGTMPNSVLITEIVLLYFVAPAIISLLIHSFMRHKGWVKPGDMKL